jgi:hypothetical protein
MTDEVPTRAGGWGLSDDGSTVTWTVADGRKGRRWREVVTDASGVRHSLLLETGPDRRFSHLELARLDGLWTVHPEPDGTLHGHQLDRSDDGVRHIEGLSFDHDAVLILEGSSLSLAAVGWAMAPMIQAGNAVHVAAVVIKLDGTIEGTTEHLTRRSETVWQIGEGRSIEIDEAGLPILREARIRPLERS